MAQNSIECTDLYFKFQNVLLSKCSKLSHCVGRQLSYSKPHPQPLSETSGFPSAVDIEADLLGGDLEATSTGDQGRTNENELTRKSQETVK